MDHEETVSQLRWLVTGTTCGLVIGFALFVIVFRVTGALYDWWRRRRPPLSDAVRRIIEAMDATPSATADCYSFYLWRVDGIAVSVGGLFGGFSHAAIAICVKVGDVNVTESLTRRERHAVLRAYRALHARSKQADRCRAEARRQQQLSKIK